MIKNIDGARRDSDTALAVALSVGDGPPGDRWLCHVPRQ